MFYDLITPGTMVILSFIAGTGITISILNMIK